MAKTVSKRKAFNFVGGLNTEAGPLTSPPNAWADGINVVPDVDGSLSVRAAINYETGYELSSTSVPANDEAHGAFVSFEWDAADGNGANNLVVVQQGAYLRFYINAGEGISANELLSASVSLASFAVSGNTNTIGVAPCTFSNANGKLLVTSQDTEPFVVTYNATAGTVSAAAVAVEFRDLTGVDDGLAVDEQDASITDLHRYNLYNQGWDATKITAYEASQSAYPSNAQQWTAGKDADDDFDPTLLVKQDFGTTPAPKGRYILGLFSQNRDAVSGLTLGLSFSQLYRPSTCAFYAGRAWFAGIRSATMSTWVLFSQVATDSTKYGKCYQEADPTSEFISDLVASDGGVIPIQDAGSVIALRPAYNSLLVFAENGVWQISGGLDSGFSATSYEVKKLSSAGCVGAASIISVDQAILYWSNDGIWRITPTNSGVLEVNNITATTIQTLYTAIPMPGRVYASGRYHLEAKCVYWLYNDGVQDSLTRRFKKNKMLVLDVRLSAFYVLGVEELDADSPYVVDLVVTKPKTGAAQTYNIVDGSGNNVQAGGNDVVVVLSPNVLRNTDVRFLTVTNDNDSYYVVFSSFDEGLVAEAKFHDWYSYDDEGQTYDAYVLTGYDMGANQGGDTMMQALYITCFFRRTETEVDETCEVVGPSSCTMQARWNWTDNVVAGKWTAGEEVYRHRRLWLTEADSAYTDGQPVVWSKSKVRGRGKCVQFKFSNEPGKDMQMLGFAVTYLGNANV